MVPCTFCRIVSQDLPSASVGGNDGAVAFLDIRPVNPGHTLIVPRRHVPSFADLIDAESAAVFRLIREVSSALRSALPGCAGITLSAADGDAAGQEVPHAHFHLIPRSPGDGFGWRRFGSPADPANVGSTAALVRRAIASGNP